MPKDSLGRNRKPSQDVGRAGLPVEGDGGLNLVMPDHLAEYGTEAWKRSINFLRSRGILDTSDHYCVEMFATAYEDFRRCRESVELEGYMLYEGENQHAKRNPNVVTMENAWGRCVKLMGEMGFSPTARRRVNAEGTESDPLKEFISQSN